MVWLTWRQHRQQLLLTLIGLAALAALVVPTGLRMHDALVDTGLADCLAEVGRQDDACNSLANDFSQRFGALEPVGILFLFLPLVLGLFFGAPLVAREVEHGTHRLVWTQGVSRLRWATVKLTVLGLTALAVALAYALLVSWWIGPLNEINSSRFEPGLFDMQGVVPVGYTLFALALGVFAGTVKPKVLSAMALTLFGFVAVRLAVALVARPRFESPLTWTTPVVGGVEPTENGDWIFSTGIYDAAGHQLRDGGMSFCPATAPEPCVSRFGEGAYNELVYQPVSRFWLFQSIETGIFVALAAILIALALVQLRRRVS
jgi:hypothetical protein